jgi:hypothetical protein
MGQQEARGGLTGHFMMCKYYNIRSVYDEISVFRLKKTMREMIELHAFNFLDPSLW